MGRDNRPPERWDEYVALGAVIEGTRFLPFKTPFKRPVRCDNGIVESFNTNDLLRRVGNLGLVISLVKTDRYYNPALLRQNQVEHIRRPLEGNRRIPPEDEIQRIFGAIDRFVLNNAEDDVKLIGVHCTHGVNRTGYIICRYMIHKMGIAPEEAIRRFETGRGHEFDHPELKDALRFLEPAVDPEMRDWHSMRAEIESGQEEVASDFDPDELEFLTKKPKKNADRSTPREIERSKEAVEVARGSHEREDSEESQRSTPREIEQSKEAVEVARGSDEREDSEESQRSTPREFEQSKEAVEVARGSDDREDSEESQSEEKTEENQEVLSQSPDGLRRFIGSPAPEIFFREAEKYLGPRRRAKRPE